MAKKKARDWRPALAKAIGGQDLTNADLLDLLVYVEQEQAENERLLARLKLLGPASPDAPSSQKTARMIKFFKRQISE